MLRGALRINVIAALTLLTNSRIGQREGDIVTRLLLVARHNGHFIFIGINLTRCAFAGGLSHRNGRFLRLVAMNFINRVNINVG